MTCLGVLGSQLGGRVDTEWSLPLCIPGAILMEVKGQDKEVTKWINEPGAAWYC